MRLALGIAFASMFTTTAFADCQIDRWRFNWGQQTSTTFHITNSSSCKSTFSAGRGSGIENISISQPPGHGSATTSGSGSDPWVSYQPKKGFKGSDSFTFSINGGSKSSQSPATVVVTVDSQ